MIRTQISLGAEEISWLKKEAQKEGLSMAGIIRKLIESFRTQVSYHIKNRTRLPARQEGMLKKRFPFIGMAQDTPPTDAKYVDSYLYGEGEAL